MRTVSILFLKAVVFLISIGIAIILIKFPQTEGRSTNLDLIGIYTDPLIIYVYIASIPVFVGLYQAFKLLTLVEANKIFSTEAIKALNTIKYVSLSFIGFVAVGELYLRFFVHGDDLAGPTALGIIFCLITLVIVAIADICESLLKNKLS